MGWPRRGGWVALALLLATVATARPGDPLLYPPKAGDGVAIYLVDNGAHTDIALPRGPVLAAGGPLAAALAQTTSAPWVLVGWGDARFYEAATPWRGRVLDGLRALAGGRPTVVRLQGVGEPRRAWLDSVHRLVISRAGFTALVGRADRAFRLRDGAPVKVTGVQSNPDDAFFESGESFGLWRLCNHWTAELLAAAGLPTTPVLDTLPAGLLLDLQLRARVRGA